MMRLPLILLIAVTLTIGACGRKNNPEKPVAERPVGMVITLPVAG